MPVISAGADGLRRPTSQVLDRPDDRARGTARAGWLGFRAGFIGDGYNALANSMIVGCLAVGMTVTVACPPHYRPAADVLMLAKPTVISSS